jgi:hypothetical protein
MADHSVAVDNNEHQLHIEMLRAQAREMRMAHRAKAAKARQQSCWGVFERYFAIFKVVFLITALIGMSILTWILFYSIRRGVVFIINGNTVIESFFQRFALDPVVVTGWFSSCGQKWWFTSEVCTATFSGIVYFHECMVMIGSVTWILIYSIVAVILYITAFHVLPWISNWMTELTEKFPKLSRETKDNCVIVKWLTFSVIFVWAFAPALYSTPATTTSVPVPVSIPLAVSTVTQPIDNALTVQPKAKFVSTNQLQTPRVKKCVPKKLVSRADYSTAAISTFKSVSTEKPWSARLHNWAKDSCVASVGIEFVMARFIEPDFDNYDVAMFTSLGAHCAIKNYLYYFGEEASTPFMENWETANQWARSAHRARQSYRALRKLPSRMWHAIQTVWTGVKDGVSTALSLYAEWKQEAKPYAEALKHCEGSGSWFAHVLSIWFSGNLG